MATFEIDLTQTQDDKKKRSNKKGLKEWQQSVFEGETDDGTSIKIVMKNSPETYNNKFGAWPMGIDAKFKITLEPDLGATSTAVAMQTAKEVLDDDSAKEAFDALNIDDI